MRDQLTNVNLGSLLNYYIYSYDANGNRIKFTNPYEQPAQNNEVIDNYDRITAHKSNVGEQTYSYDAEGNMIDKHYYSDQSAMNSVKDIKYVFNYQNQITEIWVDGQRIAQYQYDTGKQRIYSDTHYAGVDETKLYNWDSAGHIIAESTVTGTILTKYIYAGNNKVAMVKPDGKGGETLYFFINDLQGTPVLITDTSGNVVQKTQTDPYGNVER